MQQERTPAVAPERAIPYVLRAGDGQSLNVAGQVIRLLAGTADTAGGFGAVMCEATLDRQPIPLHFHEKEHDTWYCTRGRLRIWTGNVSRLLTDGDFAYVKPGDVHAYQSVAPRTQFFGVVAPGGWEGFFREAGMPWLQPGLPAATHPYDFSRMGPAMGKYRVMRVEGANYAELSNGDDTDRAVPTDPVSYVLQAGYGTRTRLSGHLSTTLLSRAGSQGHIDMRTIEAGRGARMPLMRHARTHVACYVVEGTMGLTINGAPHVLGAGDFANVPAGSTYATDVSSEHARWVLTSAHGDGLSFWDTLGETTGEFTFQTSNILTSDITSGLVHIGCDMELLDT